jgi:hypothetical protein
MTTLYETNKKLSAFALRTMMMMMRGKRRIRGIGFLQTLHFAT